MKKNVWFFNAHPDDINAGLALALILKELSAYQIHVCTYTRGEGGLKEQGVPFDECAAIRTIEEEKVCAELGVKPIFMPEKNDGSCAASIETCRLIADMLQKDVPEAVITHFPSDIHADHVMCAAAVLKAVRLAGVKTEIYFYRQNRQSRNFPEDFYLPFDEDIMKKKCDILKLYECQNGAEIALRERTEDAYNGYRYQVPFAECYASFQLPGTAHFFSELAQARKEAAEKQSSLS